MALNPHPFVQGTNNVLPNQLISKVEKNEKWKERSMDSLEAIGLYQLRENLRFDVNYRLANAEINPSDYMDLEESEIDPILDLSKKLDLPSVLQHYDIITPSLMALIGEYTALPEVSRAVATGEEVLNQRERAKAQLITELCMNILEKEAEAELIRRGLTDVQFNTDEEKQQYLQQLEAEKQKLIPEELKNFDGSWQHIAEKWANIQLKNNVRTYNQKKVNYKEFEDMLITGRAFRHFKITPNGRTEETWNPKNTFYYKGYDIEYPEDGAYIGRCTPMDAEEIISRFGQELTKEQIESLQSFSSRIDPKATDALGNQINYVSTSGKPYMTILPYGDEKLDYVPQFNQNSVLPLEDLLYSENENYYLFSKRYAVTEAYWFAQAKIGKVQYIDPETGQLIKEIIDEDFVVPEGFKQVNASFTDEEYEDEPNIVIWTWVNELWEGKKITGHFGGTGARKPIYFGIKRSPFQGKGDSNIWDKKLPVVGLIYNNRNKKAQSFVDIFKPYQVLHNIIMNYFRKIFENQILPFIAMDPNLIPNTKDYGKRSMEKWLQLSQMLGIAPVDTHPNTTQGANAQGGQFPRPVEVSTYQHLLAFLDMAERIRGMALRQAGLSDQRLGDIKSTETATGVQNAISKSYTQTSKYYSEFQDYKRRCLQVGLNFDQYVQSKSEIVKASIIHSDSTNQFLKLNGTDLLLADLFVFVTDSQEEADKIRLSKQLLVENNTVITKLSSKLKGINAETMTELISMIEIAEKELDKQVQEQQQIQQQQEQQRIELEQERLRQEDDHFRMELENKLKEKLIQYFGANQNNDSSTNAKTFMDLQKLNQTQAFNDATLDLQRRKLDIEAQKLASQGNDFTNQERIEVERIKAQRYAEAQKNKREAQRDKRAAKKSTKS